MLLAQKSVVVLLFLWSRPVLLVILGSLTYPWSAHKVVGCWMVSGGLSHVTGDQQAWRILQCNGASHVPVLSPFLAGCFLFVCQAFSDFQACTGWALILLQTFLRVTFAKIPWAKASHMIKLKYRVDKNSLSWSEELQHFFAKEHAYKER